MRHIEKRLGAEFGDQPKSWCGTTLRNQRWFGSLETSLWDWDGGRDLKPCRDCLRELRRIIDEELER